MPPNWQLLANLSPQGEEDGTEMRHNLLKSLILGAGMAPVGSCLAEEDQGETAAEAVLIPNWQFLANLSPQGEEDGTEMRHNLLKSLILGAGMAPVGSSLAEECRREPAGEAAMPPKWEFRADLAPQTEEGGTERRRKLLERLDSGTGMHPVGSSILSLREKRTESNGAATY